ncbi:MAG TPA: cupin domain-containing protein [Kofleriaceae bacterium]|jgi:uncharacterized cupin superfamily protein|nr:cupin domain-containing protein [Kofleriaceae bacterium]
MSDRHPNIVNADQLAWFDVSEATRAAFPGDAGRGLQFGARAKQLGAAAGCARLGCSLYELPPGKRAFPFHYHLANEEAIYLLDGEATLRLGDREIAVRAGDYIAIPVGPGHAHQLINTSAAPVHYLCMSTTLTPEVAVFPDTQKIGFSTALGGPAGGPFELQRLGTSLTYYEGENEGEDR